MAYTPHEVVKPEAIASAMVEGLKDELVIANTFTRFDAAEFLGKAGDKITKRVPGALPFREWDFRNDRREPLRVDQYTETTVDMTVSAKWIYSAIEMTPEQKQFDFGGSFGDLFNLQTDALARGIEHDAYQQLVNAPYELVRGISVDPTETKAQHDIGRDHLFNQFVNLSRDLRKMRTPDTNFTVIAGSDFIAELIKSNKLIRSAGQGENAFAQATIGKYAGFNVIEGPYTMAPNEAYVFAKSGFLFWNAAPPAPQGAVKFANANKNGLSMAWFQDYQAEYVIDRSIFMSWKSWNYAQDFLSLETANGQLLTSPEQFFLRGAKLVLVGTDAELAGVSKEPGDGKTDTPGGNPESYLAKAYTGQLADGVVPAGLLMPPHLREGAVTSNSTGTLVEPTDGTAGTDATPGTTV
jgi:hypothetical protein